MNAYVCTGLDDTAIALLVFFGLWILFSSFFGLMLFLIRRGDRP